MTCRSKDAKLEEDLLQIRALNDFVNRQTAEGEKLQSEKAALEEKIQSLQQSG